LWNMQTTTCQAKAHSNGYASAMATQMNHSLYANQYSHSTQT
jgi:hypothetical protein